MNENQDEVAQQRPATFKFILGDVHFWVPLAVLIAGLILLAWVS